MDGNTADISLSYAEKTKASTSLSTPKTSQCAVPHILSRKKYAVKASPVILQVFISHTVVQSSFITLLPYQVMPGINTAAHKREEIQSTYCTAGMNFQLDATAALELCLHFCNTS